MNKLIRSTRREMIRNGYDPREYDVNETPGYAVVVFRDLHRANAMRDRVAKFAR